MVMMLMLMLMLMRQRERERERAVKVRDMRERGCDEIRSDEMSVVIISAVVISNNSCIHLYLEQTSPTHGCHAVSNPIKTSINT